MDKLLMELKDHPLLYTPKTALPATLKALLESEEGTELLVAFIKKVALLTYLATPVAP